MHGPSACAGLRGMFSAKLHLSTGGFHLLDGAGGGGAYGNCAGTGQFPSRKQFVEAQSVQVNRDLLPFLCRAAIGYPAIERFFEQFQV